MVIDEDYSNLEEFASWDFEIHHFQKPSYVRMMHAAWNAVSGRLYSEEVRVFLQEHEPRLVFSNYGQNQEVSVDDVGDVINARFNLAEVDILTLSLATNVRVRQGFSVVLSEQNIHSMFPRPQDVQIYRKAFHSQFCNFATVQRFPSSLEPFGRNNLQFKRSVSGFNGYSDVANVLRRNEHSEPFSKRPVATFFSIPPPFAVPAQAKFREKLSEQSVVVNTQRTKIRHAIEDKVTHGCGYRFEITFSYDLHQAATVQQIQNDLSLAQLEFDEWVLEFGCPLLRVVPTSIFPKIVSVFTDSLYKTIELGMQRYSSQPSNVSLWEKELMAFTECLIRYAINGNQRNLTHSLFRHLGIMVSIKKYNFPFFVESNLNETKTGFNPTAAFVRVDGISLLDQQAGILVANKGKVRCSSLLLLMEGDTDNDEATALQFFANVLDVLVCDIHTLVCSKAGKNRQLVTLPLDIKEKLQKCCEEETLFLLCSNARHFAGNSESTIDEIFTKWTSLGGEYEFPHGIFERPSLNYLYVIQGFVYYCLLNERSRFYHELKRMFVEYFQAFNYLPELNSKGWTGRLIKIVEQVSKKRDGRSNRNQRPDLLDFELKTDKYKPQADWQREYLRDFAPTFIEFWDKKFQGQEGFPFADIFQCSDGMKALVLMSMVGSLNQLKLTSLTKPRLGPSWAACFFAKALNQIQPMKKESIQMLKKPSEHNKITAKLVTNAGPKTWKAAEESWLVMDKAQLSESFFEHVFAKYLN